MRRIRIIPRLDIKGPNVVKGVQTEGLRVVGDPVKLAKQYFLEGADELIYMDIVASLYGRNADYEIIKKVSDEIFIPLTVGGGIRSIHDISSVLSAGADKVAINTGALRDKKFLADAIKTFGSQCIVLSVEAKRNNSGWEAYTDGGREPTGIDAIQWVKEAIKIGVGEILLMSIDNDGTKKGYDAELLEKTSEFSSVPIIIHGGASDYKSLIQAVKNGADACSASSVFHFKDMSVHSLKKSLVKEKINVRQT